MCIIIETLIEKNNECLLITKVIYQIILVSKIIFVIIFEKLLLSIIHQLSDACNDSRRITKSRIFLQKYVFVKIGVPEEQIISVNKSKVRLKCGRLVGPKEKSYRKKSEFNKCNDTKGKM